MFLNVASNGDDIKVDVLLREVWKSTAWTRKMRGPLYIEQVSMDPRPPTAVAKLLLARGTDILRYTMMTVIQAVV